MRKKFHCYHNWFAEILSGTPEKDWAKVVQNMKREFESDFFEVLQSKFSKIQVADNTDEYSIANQGSRQAYICSPNFYDLRIPGKSYKKVNMRFRISPCNFKKSRPLYSKAWIIFWENSVPRDIRLNEMFGASGRELAEKVMSLIKEQYSECTAIDLEPKHTIWMKFAGTKNKDLISVINYSESIELLREKIARELLKEVYSMIRAWGTLEGRFHWKKLEQVVVEENLKIESIYAHKYNAKLTEFVGITDKADYKYMHLAPKHIAAQFIGSL